MVCILSPKLSTDSFPRLPVAHKPEPFFSLSEESCRQPFPSLSKGRRWAQAEWERLQ